MKRNTLCGLRHPRARAIAGYRTCRQCGAPYRDSWKQCPRCTPSLGGRDGRVAGPVAETAKPEPVIGAATPEPQKIEYPEWLKKFSEKCKFDNWYLLKTISDGRQSLLLRNSAHALLAFRENKPIPGHVDLAAVEMAYQESDMGREKK